jgi:ankyrin repeat protein
MSIFADRPLGLQNNNTALHWTCMHLYDDDMFALSKVLVEHGVDINAQNTVSTFS